MVTNSFAEGLSVSEVFIKRLFDFFIALFGLLLAGPVILFAWLLLTIEIKANGFFIQKRVGLHGKLFNVIKLRTMKAIDGVDTTVTASNDLRITKIGMIFRKTKIDELPQLWNVLKGDMSIVGPRPDVSGYADKLVGEDRVLLSIRPGVTGPASLKYKNEEVVLSEQVDPRKYNDDVIWPDKVKINKEYIKNYSFTKDLYYIWKTIAG